MNSARENLEINFRAWDLGWKNNKQKPNSNFDFQLSRKMT